MSNHENNFGTQMENSPSLKLKIKLGPNMKAEPASSRVLTPKEDEESNPLKIIIKKSDLPNSTVANPTVSSDKVSLTLLPFPSVVNKSMFKKACACTSFEQLEKWSEKDLSLLGEELESMRKSFKEFSTALQLQLESLETWRQKSDPTKKKSDIRQFFSSNAKPVAQAFNLTAPVTPSVVEKPPKGKSKKINKKRKSQDSSSGDDPSFSVTAKESSDSASDDEIDVVDIEENGGDPDADPEKANRVKVANQDYTPNKRAQKNKLAMMIRKRNSGGSRGRNKVNRISRQSTRERKKSRKGEEIDSSAEEVSGKGGKWPNNNFWKEMEPFFAPFTQEDAKFCAPQTIDPEDPAFQIPTLGRHYSDDWEAEDDDEYYEPIRSRSRSEPIPRPQESGNIADTADRNPSCGDLTSRILAALIEENVVPNIPTFQETEINGGSPDTDLNMTDVTPVQSEVEQFPFKAAQDEGLPLETPPTFDYSHATMLSLEDRIKLELRSIGLLDDHDLDIDNQSREDDEICSELRKMQKELKDQIISNNVIRSKVSTLVAESMANEEKLKKERAANATLEKTYLKLMRKKKRKPAVGKGEGP